MWLWIALACTGDGSGSGALLDSSESCDLCGGGCVDHVELGSASHVEGEVAYDTKPPMGGDHNACWAEWGVHAEAVADENWVHNLEHGGVVFLYNCPDGCETEVEQLSGYVTALGPTALLTPYAEMEDRFAAVSWGWRLLQDCLDLSAMQTFYANHVDQGPESSTSGPADGCM